MWLSHLDEKQVTKIQRRSPSKLLFENQLFKTPKELGHDEGVSFVVAARRDLNPVSDKFKMKLLF